jgi:hypothetical protein
MSIRLIDLLNIHQDLTEVMEKIDVTMPAGVERALAWRRLSDSRAIIRAAIESVGASVEIQEAA